MQQKLSFFPSYVASSIRLSPFDQHLIICLFFYDCELVNFALPGYDDQGFPSLGCLQEREKKRCMSECPITTGMIDLQLKFRNSNWTKCFVIDVVCGFVQDTGGLLFSA